MFYELLHFCCQIDGGQLSAREALTLSSVLKKIGDVVFNYQSYALLKVKLSLIILNKIIQFLYILHNNTILVIFMDDNIGENLYA